MSSGGISVKLKNDNNSFGNISFARAKEDKLNLIELYELIERINSRVNNFYKCTKTKTNPIDANVF